MKNASTEMSSSPKMVTPEISVLMSCHNSSEWLREAVDSVIAQTHSVFEFVIIDDGSTDDTSGILKKYQESDARIVVISKENTGLADSLNSGLACARGKWIARLDADDVCAPTRLEKQLSYVHRNPEVLLLGGSCAEIDAAGRVVKLHSYPAHHRSLVRDVVRVKRCFPHSSAFFRRDVALEVGSYNPIYTRTQDWDLWLRIAEQGRIACLPDSIVRFRKHVGQISNYQSGVLQLVCGVAAIVCHYLRLSGVEDPSAPNNQAGWSEFLEWIQKRMNESDMLEKRSMLQEISTAYRGSTNSLGNMLRFGAEVLRSTRARSLVWQKLFGTALPKTIAQEWMERV